MREPRPMLDIAATGFNFTCPHCGTEMSMGGFTRTPGTTIICICKQPVQVPRDMRVRAAHFGIELRNTHVFNMNDTVEFVPTAEGLELYNKFREAELPPHLAKYKRKELTPNAPNHMLIWEFMMVFGPEMAMHRNVFFQDNTVRFLHPNHMTFQGVPTYRPGKDKNG